MANLLIVDDDLFEVMPHVFALERAGHTVAKCGDVRAALEFVRDANNQIDLAIIDIMLPTLGLWTVEESSNGAVTGFRLIESILEERPRLPIVVLTVRGDLDSAVSPLVDQVARVVQKPCLPQDLLAGIDEVLSRGHDDL